MIHRTVIGKGPPGFRTFFHRDLRSLPRFTRLQRARHGKQLVDPITRNSTCLARRTALGTVRCYNALPSFVVALPSVSLFQRALHHCLCRAVAGDHLRDWQNLFHVFERSIGILHFQSLFDVAEDS